MTDRPDFKKTDLIEAAIGGSPALSALFNEAVAAMHAYVQAHKDAWGAERERIEREAVAAGKKAWGVPFHPEEVMDDVGPKALGALVIATLGHRCAATDGETLAGALRVLRDEYRAAPGP
jgi:hypothetical protein